MKLYVDNIRLGFACNSSSTHSLVLLKKGTEKPSDNDSDQYFGWHNFILASKNAKLGYLGQIIKNSLRRDDIDEFLAAKLATAIINEPGLEIDPEGSIDHQSIMILPSNAENSLNIQFLDDFKAFLMQENIVILGGSDNEDEFDISGIDKRIRSDVVDYPTVARKDDSGHWTLFDKYSGNKCRIVIGDFIDKAPKIKRASAPELVDICITKNCNKGCMYCYMNAQPDGKHANYNQITKLAYALEDLGVFEVALGGGEPTNHPEFIKILETFKTRNIVPNFTTRSLDWLHNSETCKEILDNVGQIAFSVNCTSEVKKLGSAINYLNLPTQKFSIQVVLGTCYEIKSIIKTAEMFNLKLTLLGFKDVGRGSDFIKDQYTRKLIEDDSWIQHLGYYAGVDTACLKQFGDKLKDKVHCYDKFTTEEEGKFSMYIDAVDSVCGPSSYDIDKFVPLEIRDYNGAKTIKEIFNTF
jgi:hypothetical protein